MDLAYIIVTGYCGCSSQCILKDSTIHQPVQLVGVAVVMLSLWMEGGFANESKWQARIAELEEKVRVAEAKSAEINTVIETVYVDRVQIVTDTKIIVQNNIRKSAKKMDQVCKIEPEVISILNESVKKPVKGDKK